MDDPGRQDADLCKESYRRGSSIHRKKIRAWQLLCAASPALAPLCDETARTSTSTAAEESMAPPLVCIYLSRRPMCDLTACNRWFDGSPRLEPHVERNERTSGSKVVDGTPVGRLVGRSSLGVDHARSGTGAPGAQRRAASSRIFSSPPPPPRWRPIIYPGCAATSNSSTP